MVSLATIAIAGLCAVEVALWLPHYLTWVWNCDIEIFANQAMAWRVGVLPYRDTPQNNFPGQMYLHFVLSLLGGWGRPGVFWLADALMTIGLGGLMVVWSRRRFGGTLPGWAGFLALLGWQLELSGFQVGQRDGQAAIFAVGGLLIAQAWRGRGGRWLSAIAFALAFAFRPQAALFGPAMLVLGWQAVKDDAKPWRTFTVQLAEWGCVFAIGVVLLFAPLVAAGVWRDFVREVSVVMPGGSYNAFNPVRSGRRLLAEVCDLSVVSALLAAVLLASQARPALRIAAWPWIVAFASMLFYQPISPNPAGYQLVPMRIVEAVTIAVIVAMVLDDVRLSGRDRVVVVVLILSLQARVLPRYCSVKYTIDAVRALASGKTPEAPPIYATGDEVTKWDAYRQAIAYLKEHTRPETRIANALKQLEAFNGPVGRLSAFRSSSLGWLAVDPKAVAKFVQDLELAHDSVVVWTPEDRERIPVWNVKAFGQDFVDDEPIRRAIERLYEPEARFGKFAIWKRRPGL